MSRSFFVPVEVCRNPRLPVPPYTSQAWTIRFNDLRKVGFLSGFDSQIRSEQIVVEARTRQAAQEAADLITTAAQIIHPVTCFFDFSNDQLDIKEITSDFDVNAISSMHSMRGDTWQLACILAANATRDTRYTYSVYRLANSYRLYSIPTIELDPYHSENLEQPTESDPYHPHLTVAIADSFLLAHAAIEELGIQIKASDNHPKSGNIWARDKKLGWNPKALKRLTKSLQERDIDPEGHILWHSRGKEPSAIQARLRGDKGEAMPWNRVDIHDEKIPITDAIDRCDYIRDNYIAHVLHSKPDVRFLDPYDLSNVQHLARRLLLQSLGIQSLIEDLWKHPDR